VGAEPRFSGYLRVVGYQRAPLQPQLCVTYGGQTVLPTLWKAFLMSLWTPGGEHPVDPAGTDAPTAAAGLGGQRLSPEQEAEAQEIAAEMAQVREQLSQVPAAVVVANHAMGCYELAAIHLSHQPPRLDEAQLAIDAFGALVGTLTGKLGPDEATLADALAQIRLAFVQVKASWESGPGAPEADGAPGAG